MFRLEGHNIWMVPNYITKTNNVHTSATPDAVPHPPPASQGPGRWHQRCPATTPRGDRFAVESPGNQIAGLFNNSRWQHFHITLSNCWEFLAPPLHSERILHPRLC